MAERKASRIILGLISGGVFFAFTGSSPPQRLRNSDSAPPAI
jgi:hypothetical protein